MKLKQFKCRCCKEKHYEVMASEDDVSMCKWCNEEIMAHYCLQVSEETTCPLMNCSYCAKERNHTINKLASGGFELKEK